MGRVQDALFTGSSKVPQPGALGRAFLLSESRKGKMFVKCFCAFCQNPIEFPSEYLGEKAECPHCENTTPLIDPALQKTLRVYEDSKPKTRRGRVVIISASIILIAGLILLYNYDRDELGKICFVLVFLFSVAAILSVYFLPTIAAREKRNQTAIFVLNLFLGWTLLGWVIALVWACTVDDD